MMVVAGDIQLYINQAALLMYEQDMTDALWCFTGGLEGVCFDY